MNKSALQQQIIATLEADREVAKAVLAATHEAATHAESKAENKYDTRGLEAAYLADGQRRRLHEIETALAAYRNLLPGVSSDGRVRVGALLCLDHDGAERWFFLGPDAAGLKLQPTGGKSWSSRRVRRWARGCSAARWGTRWSCASMASCSATKCCRSHSAGY